MFVLAGGRAAAATRNDMFAGSYADERLSATFTAVEDGSYTGQLKLGDKTYPVHAQQDGELPGTFAAGGDEFAFAAKWDGQTLALTTGTSHFTLKRVGGGPANPLDAAPPPANPLGGNAPYGTRGQ